MCSNLLPPPAASKSVLTPNQQRATDIMTSVSKDTHTFFDNWRGDVLRFLDGGLKDGKPDLPTLQTFLDDWQSMSPGAPGQFFQHATSAVAFFEALWHGITTPITAQIPAFTSNGDGSITLTT